jgi:CTP synthase
MLKGLTKLQTLAKSKDQTLHPCRWDSLKEPVKIAMIGKYTALSDAYLSVIKALQHACMAAGLKLSLDWVEAQYLEPEAKETDAAKYETSWQQVRLNTPFPAEVAM